jgi:glutathione-independent formaldehyde dehydrogenase
VNRIAWCKLPLDFSKAWINQLMMAILWDRIPYLGEVVNTEIIQMEKAPEAYQTFSEGSPKKFVIDPHGSVEKAA